MNVNNRYVLFNGRMIRQIERLDLIRLGVTEQGLRANYDDSDNIICITDDEHFIYEFIGSINKGNFTGCWELKTFLQWFNEI